MKSTDTPANIPKIPTIKLRAARMATPAGVDFDSVTFLQFLLNRRSPALDSN